MATPTIFISYRREDTIGHAGRLFDRLVERFGREHVFRDVDTIAAGQDFVAAVRQQIERSDFLLALIGPRWLGATDEAGHRRLADENDLVRVEIAAALGRGIGVIPVLLQGATMPEAKELPDALAALAQRNAAEIRDASFDADVARLVETLGPASRDGIGRRFLRRRTYVAAFLVAVAVAGFWTYREIALAPERARAALVRMGMAYDADTFVERAREKDEQAVKLFLRAGMGPDAANQSGQTALMWAAATGNAALARELADAGADSGKALPWAARHGRKDVLALLLARQPDQAAINAAMVNATIASRDPDAVQMLLDAGADVNHKGVDVARGARHGEPALVVAANDLKIDIVRLLLARGADANVRGALERSALQVAVSPFGSSGGEDRRRDQLEIVGALVARGADLEARGRDYWQLTPLLLAIYRRQPQLALLLVERGADVNAQAPSVGHWHPGGSALMLAAERGMADVVQALLGEGADVGARDALGESALHVAAKSAEGSGQPAVAQALLAAGADVNARNAKGQTALMLARAGDRPKSAGFVQALLAGGASGERE